MCIYRVLLIGWEMVVYLCLFVLIQNHERFFSWILSVSYVGAKVGITCDDCQSKISKMLSCKVTLTPGNVTWIPIISISIWKRYLLSNAHSYLGVLYIEFYRGVQHSIHGCQKMWPANPGSQGHPARDIPVFHNYAHQLFQTVQTLYLYIYIFFLYIFNITIDTEMFKPSSIRGDSPQFFSDASTLDELSGTQELLGPNQ